MPSTAPRRFAGFDRSALELLRELEANNNAIWFDAQRARFRDLLIEPAIDLVIEMGGTALPILTFLGAYRRLLGGPTAAPVATALTSRRR
jgi:hypothetical protein